ncbi:hypothetical protein, partial [Fischerella thermalis]|uniref:hypothetical protein n=1 Tax=Fischerella thermalis TaxID=372787 RepID=UPI001CA4FDB1
KFIYGVSFSIAAYLRKPLCVYALLPPHFRYNGCQIYAFRYKIWSSDIILLTLFLGKIYKIIR